MRSVGVICAKGDLGRGRGRRRRLMIVSCNGLRLNGRRWEFLKVPVRCRSESGHYSNRD
jgi:hypothetical protein